MPDRDAPITLSGAPLHKLLESRQDAIVDSVVANVAELVPIYAVFPQEQIDEFAAVVAKTTRLFIGVVRTGEMPDPAQMAPLVEAASRRAEEGVPLADVLAIYHLACRQAFDDISALAQDSDLVGIVHLTRLMLSFLAHATAVASSSYLASSQVSLQEKHGAKQALLDALLEGRDVGAVAARVGLTLPDRYAVLALALAAHPDEGSDQVDSAIAGRRKLRRIRHSLDIAAPDALASMTTTAATVLIPVRSDKEPPDLDKLVRELARASGVPIIGAAELARIADVATAVPLAADVLEVAVRAGGSEGVVSLDDLAVDYQLTRQTPAMARLAAMLEPLAGHPRLLETLQTYVAERLHRGRTARRMNIHPNTVDYRLRRVGEMVGLDLADPFDLQRILAALTALGAAGGQPGHEAPGQP